MEAPQNATAESPRAASRWITESDYPALRLELERALRRLCPAWLQDRREDLVQAAMLRLFENWQQSLAAGEKSRELAASYLWRVASNALIDEIRRHRRRPEVELDDALAAALPAPGQDLTEALANRTIGRALRECLQGLADTRRLAVTLHLQGFAVAEAAAQLAWDTKKVYNAVHRGLADLRDCLKGKGIEP